MLDEGTLRQKAREAIETGRVPNLPPHRLSAGNGFGTKCAVCGNPLNYDELGYELEFVKEGQGAAEYHIHVRCFAAWEQERRVRTNTGGDLLSDQTAQEQAIGPGTAAVAISAPGRLLSASDIDGTISDRERLANKRESE